MTPKGIIRTALAILGGGILLALLQGGTDYVDSESWYCLSMLLLFAGAMPRTTVWLLLGIGAGLSCYLLVTGSPMFLGLRAMHAIGSLVLAGGVYLLSLPSEMHVYKCPTCFWRGPSTALRHHCCPHCGSIKVYDTQSKILITT